LSAPFRRVFPLYVAASALVFLISACGGSGQEPAATPSDPTPPADAQAIRGLDFENASAVQSLARQFGAVQIDHDAVIYADLTMDQREEAVVPIATGGTQGNVAYVVLTLRGGALDAILTRTVDRTTRSGLKMTVEDRLLIETVGVYGPEDALCCPTQLRRTYFRWDGRQLQVEREETVPNPVQPRS
jgi:hypothetical protein